jgi:hypothetical protein
MSTKTRESYDERQKAELRLIVGLRNFYRETGVEDQFGVGVTIEHNYSRLDGSTGSVLKTNDAVFYPIGSITAEINNVRWAAEYSDDWAARRCQSGEIIPTAQSEANREMLDEFFGRMVDVYARGLYDTFVESDFVHLIGEIMKTDWVSMGNLAGMLLVAQGSL